MASHSSILAWRIPWIEKPGGLWSIGLQSVGHSWTTNTFTFHPCSVKLKVLVAQSYPTLSDPMDCTLPGSSVPGILQTRILEWVAIPFSKGSSRPRDGTQVSCIAGKFFTVWATREALLCSEELSIQKRRIVENRTRIRGIAYGNRGMHKCDGSKVEMTHSFQGVRES